MLQLSTLKFLSALKKNNNKIWFDANRKLYENAKADFTNLVEALIAGTAKFDSAILTLKAKDCMFRINRDIRFSKDKSPYKSNMGASINPGGKKTGTPGYYFHCEPGGHFAAGGLYMPQPEDLAKIRQEIDYNFGEWKKIVSDKTFKKYFKAVDGIEILRRPPKGYTDDNPAIEFIKMKSYIVSRALTDTDITDKNLVKNICRSFEAMKPMINFINSSLQ